MKRTARLGQWLLLLLWITAQTAMAANPQKPHLVLEAKGVPSALWGVMVVESKSGQLIYQRNAKIPFIPASTVKLFSTAVALDRLGADFQFETRLQFPAGNWKKSGIIQGDLTIVGSGDPTFGTEEGAGGKGVLQQWAASLKKQGVTKVQGNIVGVDDIFVDEPLGQGWAWDDEPFSFSAQPSGLTAHGGVVDYRIPKNKKSRLKASQIKLVPNTKYISKTVQTAASGTPFSITRERAKNRLVVSIPKKQRGNPAKQGKISVENPTAYTAFLFKEALQRAGIKVTGKAFDRDQIKNYKRPKIGKVWIHKSHPLKKILSLANKRSINLVAENLLRRVGLGIKKGETQPGSVQRGMKAVDRFLKQHKIPKAHYRLVDGSGLSRYNLVRPQDFVRLLRAMRSHPQAKVFRDSLSVAGKDGTLKWRFRKTDLEGKLRAKTGTLSGIRSIVGYLTTPQGHELTFVVIANHFVSGTRKIRDAMDKFLVEIAPYADRSMTRKRLENLDQIEGRDLWTF